MVDAIYKVRETPFLHWAKEQGAQTENGLGMLIGQAAESFFHPLEIQKFLLQNLIFQVGQQLSDHKAR